MTPPRRDVRRRRHGASMTAPAAPTPPRGDEGALTRARSRAQFVSEASNILRSSPVLEESLVAFARFAVPVLADWVAIAAAADFPDAERMRIRYWQA